LQQLGGNRRQLGRHGFRFARHMFSLGQKYASNTKLRTGPYVSTLSTRRSQSSLSKADILQHVTEVYSVALRYIAQSSSTMR
ncbi:hypothetical protein, partial [Burkholderia gladioli]|uniref:hypothetical protein n=1 Tax=Burkholderia gladioli TaxID=28095 RepID=UPI001ABBDAC7